MNFDNNAKMLNANIIHNRINSLENSDLSEHAKKIILLKSIVQKIEVLAAYTGKKLEENLKMFFFQFFGYSNYISVLNSRGLVSDQKKPFSHALRAILVSCSIKELAYIERGIALMSIVYEDQFYENNKPIQMISLEDETLVKQIGSFLYFDIADYYHHRPYYSKNYDLEEVKHFNNYLINYSQFNFHNSIISLFENIEQGNLEKITPKLLDTEQRTLDNFM